MSNIYTRQLAARAEEAALNFEDAIELGKFKVNLFPFCEYLSCHMVTNSFTDLLPVVRHVPMWFPFAEFQRTAALWRERLSLAVTAPFERVKEDMVSNGQFQKSSNRTDPKTFATGFGPCRAELHCTMP